MDDLIQLSLFVGSFVSFRRLMVHFFLFFLFFFFNFWRAETGWVASRNGRIVRVIFFVVGRKRGQNETKSARD